MPNFCAAPSLEVQCLQIVSKHIEWFTSHHNKLDYLNATLAGQLVTRLMNIPGLSSRHFQLVLLDSLNHLDLSRSCDQHAEEYIGIIASIIQQKELALITIDLSNVLQIPNHFWRRITPSLNYVQKLHLRSTNCGDQEFRTISVHCLLLTELDLSLCERVTNWSVSSIHHGPEMRRLQHLNLMQTRVDEIGIRSLLEHRPGLLSLNWRNTISVLSHIHHNSRTTTSRILLQHLIGDHSYRIGSLSAAVHLCQHVVKVSIECASSLTANDLRSLSQLTVLKELHILLENNANGGHYLDFGEAFDILLVTHGSTMQQLSLGRIRNVDLHRIFQCCPRLSYLSLQRNQSYVSMLTVPRLPMNLVKFNLTTRDRESRTEEWYRDLSTLDLSTILASPFLRCVNIAGCQTIDDSILSNISQQLHILELESCRNVSMDSLWHVINQRCLKSIKIYRCQRITSHNIHELRNLISQSNWDLTVDYYSDTNY